MVLVTVVASGLATGLAIDPRVSAENARRYQVWTWRAFALAPGMVVTIAVEATCWRVVAALRLVIAVATALCAGYLFAMVMAIRWARRSGR
jgi:hypothetical protein